LGGTIELTQATALNSGTGKVWRPRVCHPLRPAPSFQGRHRLRADVLSWTRALASPDRVLSLLGVGGTGKTALVERVTRDLADAPPAGLLVWSFSEDPRPEAFLRSACEYFAGEPPAATGDLLECLRSALGGEEP